MGVSYHHASRFHGKSVVAHTRDGKSVIGMVRRVTPHEVWIEVMHSRVRPISDKSQEHEIIVANQIGTPEINIDQTSFHGHFHHPFFARDRIIALVLFDLLVISLFVW